VLYLLDANVLITANDNYYPIDQVPEFWSWIHHQSRLGNVKIPLEIMEEIKAGHKDNDPLLDWINENGVYVALLLDEPVDAALVRVVVSEGYANDLTDEEVERLGRDPFLVAYGPAAPDRAIVTVETSSPGKKRHNRKVPDVCAAVSVQCCGPFEMNRALGFRTSWKA
jgi:hypothetical protein